MYISLFTVDIYVNYTSKFRELFEVTMYILDNFTLPYFSVLKFLMFYKVYSEPEPYNFNCCCVQVCSQHASVTHRVLRHSCDSPRAARAV